MNDVGLFLRLRALKERDFDSIARGLEAEEERITQVEPDTNKPAPEA